MFGLHMAIATFGPCEEHAKTLQRANYSAIKVRQAAKMLAVRRQQNSEETTASKQIWKEARCIARLDSKKSLNRGFLAVINCVTQEIKRRFYHFGMNHILMLENILIKAGSGHNFTAHDLRNQLGVRASDFDLERLGTQLVLLPTLSVVQITRVEDVAKTPQGSSHRQCGTFSAGP